MTALLASLTLSRICSARVNCSLHVGVRRVAQRMLPDHQRLRLRLAVHRQPHLVGARQRLRTVGLRAPQDHPREGHRGGVVEIPVRAIEARGHRRGRRTAASAPAAGADLPAALRLPPPARRRALQPLVAGGRWWCGRRLPGRRGRRSFGAAPAFAAAAASSRRRAAVNLLHELSLRVEHLDRHLLGGLPQQVQNRRRPGAADGVGAGLKSMEVGAGRFHALLPQRLRCRRGCRSCGRASRSRSSWPRPRRPTPARRAGSATATASGRHRHTRCRSRAACRRRAARAASGSSRTACT